MSLQMVILNCVTIPYHFKGLIQSKHFNFHQELKLKKLRMMTAFKDTDNALKVAALQFNPRDAVWSIEANILSNSAPANSFSKYCCGADTDPDTSLCIGTELLTLNTGIGKSAYSVFYQFNANGQGSRTE